MCEGKRSMVMNEMEGRRRDHGRSRITSGNVQSSQSRHSQTAKVSRDPLPMDALQSDRHVSRHSSLTTNINTQTSQNSLKSERFSTSYDPKNNNINNQTSRDTLQSVR
jgi:hypothetical protein